MNKITGLWLSTLVGVVLLSGCGVTNSDKEPQNEDGFKTDESVEVDGKIKDAGKGVTGAKGVDAVKDVKGAKDVKDRDKGDEDLTPVSNTSNNEDAVQDLKEGLEKLVEGEGVVTYHSEAGLYKVDFTNIAVIKEFSDVIEGITPLDTWTEFVDLFREVSEVAYDYRGLSNKIAITNPIDTDSLVVLIDNGEVVLDLLTELVNE